MLVYSGPGVSPLSLSHTILTLSLLLLPHYTVQPITPTTLATQPWEPSCALLVFPGGRDLPYVDELSTKTKVTRRIREFVHQGGRYLGICAGAYFGSETVVFDQGGDMEVVGQRDLVSGYPTNNPLNHPVRTTDTYPRHSSPVDALGRRSPDSAMPPNRAHEPSRSP